MAPRPDAISSGVACTSNVRALRVERRKRWFCGLTGGEHVAQQFMQAGVAHQLQQEAALRSRAAEFDGFEKRGIRKNHTQVLIDGQNAFGHARKE